MAPSKNTSRLIIIVISLLLASPREAWGQDISFPACQNRSRDQFESARQEVIGSLKRENLYLTFVLDVSGSTKESLGEIKQFTLDLVNYAISEAGVVIHPNHTRVQVITFNRTAKRRVFSSAGDHIEACDLYNIINCISQQTHDAFTAVHEAFKIAYQDIQDNSRDGGHAVLFLVSDGSFPPQSEKKVQDETSKLTELGVQLFTVGVGQYNDAEGDGLQWVVAPDDHHYLCYHYWQNEFSAVNGTNQETACPPGSCRDGACDNYKLCGDKNLLVGMVILGVVVVLFLFVTLLVLLAGRQKRRQGVRNFNFFICINFMTNGKLFKDVETNADTCQVATGVSALRTLYETPAVPTETNVYEEIKTQMRDWDVHIRHLGATTDLHHVVIFDTKEEVMTCTEDFQLGACEVQHLQIVLTSGRRGEVFQLAAKAYKITSIEQNAHVTAREISLSGEKAVVCVRTSGRFLVIGIGPEAAEASCMESVSTLLTELEVANDF